MVFEKMNETLKMKILKIFKTLFTNSMDKLNERRLQHLYQDGDERELYEILIDELKDVHYEKQLIEDEFHEIKEVTKRGDIIRNTEKICYLLKKLEGFNRFMRFNLIDEDDITKVKNLFLIYKACSFMRLEHFKTNSTIFKQGDLPKKFYVILNGKVSIRRRRFRNEEDEEEEEEMKRKLELEKKEKKKEKKEKKKKGDLVSPEKKEIVTVKQNISIDSPIKVNKEVEYFDKDILINRVLFNDVFKIIANNNKSPKKIQENDEKINEKIDEKVPIDTAQKSEEKKFNCKSLFDPNDNFLRNSMFQNELDFDNPDGYRKLITSNLNNIEKEDEVVQLSTGTCFGEWGLIYNSPRSGSAYSIEDTYLISIEKEFFKSLFHKNIIKAINKKKNFLLKKLPFLRGWKKIDDILKNINPSFYNHGEFIYTEKDKATDIFLIFQGEGILKKFINKNEKNYKNPDEIKENKGKLRTMLKLTRGGICGTECLNNKDYYDTNFISYGSTAIIKFNCASFGFKDKFIITNFQRLHSQQEILIKNVYNAIKNTLEKTNLKISNAIDYNNFEKNIIEKISSTNNVNEIIEVMNNKRKKYRNDFNDINFIKARILEENYFEREKEKEIFMNNLAMTLQIHNMDDYDSADEQINKLYAWRKIERTSKRNISVKIEKSFRGSNTKSKFSVKSSSPIKNRSSFNLLNDKSNLLNKRGSLISEFQHFKRSDYINNMFNNVNLKNSLAENFSLNNENYVEYLNTEDRIDKLNLNLKIDKLSFSPKKEFLSEKKSYFKKKKISIGSIKEINNNNTNNTNNENTNEFKKHTKKDSYNHLTNLYSSNKFDPSFDLMRTDKNDKDKVEEKNNLAEKSKKFTDANELNKNKNKISEFKSDNKSVDIVINNKLDEVIPFKRHFSHINKVEILEENKTEIEPNDFLTEKKPKPKTSLKNLDFISNSHSISLFREKNIFTSKDRSKFRFKKLNHDMQKFLSPQYHKDENNSSKEFLKLKNSKKNFSKIIYDFISPNNIFTEKILREKKVYKKDFSFRLRQRNSIKNNKNSKLEISPILNKMVTKNDKATVELFPLQDSNINFNVGLENKIIKIRENKTNKIDISDIKDYGDSSSNKKIIEESEKKNLNLNLNLNLNFNQNENLLTENFLQEKNEIEAENVINKEEKNQSKLNEPKKIPNLAFNNNREEYKNKNSKLKKNIKFENCNINENKNQNKNLNQIGKNSSFFMTNINSICNNLVKSNTLNTKIEILKDDKIIETTKEDKVEDTLAIRKKCFNPEKPSSKIKNSFFNKKKCKYFRSNTNLSPKFQIECKDNNIIKLENVNVNAQLKNEKINSIKNKQIIEDDLINVKNLKENFLNFNENAELHFNPFSYQVDIERAAVLLNNNKKEYCKNYKNFSENKNSSKGFFYRNIKSSQNFRTFKKDENNESKKLSMKNLNENVEFRKNYDELISKNKFDWKIDNDKARKKVAYCSIKNKENRFRVTSLYGNKKRNLNESLDEEHNEKIRKYTDIFNKDLMEGKKKKIIEDSLNLENDFQSQFINEHNVNAKEEFFMRNTGDFFYKNPANDTKVKFTTKTGNNKSVKDFQALSSIMNNWVDPKLKENEFNTGIYNLPLFHEKVKMISDRVKK